MTEGIVNEILEFTQAQLEAALITNIATTDPARAGVVKIGALQGDPDPDVARISVVIHHNDPENIDGPWRDFIEIVEIGGVVTWARRFTVTIRCLLETTKETLDEARPIAAIVRDRTELALLKELFTGIQTDDEYVSRGPMASSLKSDMLQGVANAGRASRSSEGLPARSLWPSPSRPAWEFPSESSTRRTGSNGEKVRCTLR